MLDSIQLQHFRNLVSLAAADGKVQEIERITLSKIAYDQGIPLDRLNIMLKKADEYIYLIPQNKEDKEKQLKDMIQLAMVDGDFATAEYNLILLVGNRLGYTKTETESLIEKYG